MFHIDEGAFLNDTKASTPLHKFGSGGRYSEIPTQIRRRCHKGGIFLY